jgi:hypothetical protein
LLEIQVIYFTGVFPGHLGLAMGYLYRSRGGNDRWDRRMDGAWGGLCMIIKPPTEVVVTALPSINGRTSIEKKGKRTKSLNCYASHIVEQQKVHITKRG